MPLDIEVTEIRQPPKNGFTSVVVFFSEAEGDYDTFDVTNVSLSLPDLLNHFVTTYPSAVAIELTHCIVREWER